MIIQETRCRPHLTWSSRATASVRCTCWCKPEQNQRVRHNLGWGEGGIHKHTHLHKHIHIHVYAHSHTLHMHIHTHIHRFIWSHPAHHLRGGHLHFKSSTLLSHPLALEQLSECLLHAQQCFTLSGTANSPDSCTVCLILILQKTQDQKDVIILISL